MVDGGGRRLAACERLGWEPKTREVEVDDPVAYVLSLNLHRRQLTPSQAAMVGARARAIYDRAAKERMAAGGGDKKSGAANLPDPIHDQGRSRDQAAKAVGVGGKSIDAATKVLTKGTPELVAAVDEGRIAVSTAGRAGSRAAGATGGAGGEEAGALAYQRGAWAYLAEQPAVGGQNRRFGGVGAYRGAYQGRN